MSDDLPYMQFFPADHLADCGELSAGTRGAWHTFLCKAWMARSAALTFKVPQWSRIFGATNVEQTERIIAEIEEWEIGDVIREEDGKVTLVSRRIERDLESMGADKKCKSEAARNAANMRWEKERKSKEEQEQCKRNADAMQAHPKRNADAMRKDAIPESRIQSPEKVSLSKKKRRPDSVDDVVDYAKQRGLPKSDGEHFFDSQEAGGWKRNGQAIKDWKACFRTWQTGGYLPSQKQKAVKKVEYVKPPTPDTGPPMPKKLELPEPEFDWNGLLLQHQRGRSWSYWCSNDPQAAEALARRERPFDDLGPIEFESAVKSVG